MILKKQIVVHDEGVPPYCNNAKTLDLGTKISSAISHILVMLLQV